ncbi:MAG: c-type cytochrome biogenesis protein CcmI, partial [Pseudomonadota bacterium]|nr:c-type cytochrome biogenesis protein CcmI [Pseudomonadota bacterium]
LIGAPGLPDRPLAQRLAEIRAAEPPRPSQAEAERMEAERLANLAPAEAPAQPGPDAEETARLRDLVGRLRDILEDRPDDVRGRRLLADSLLRLEDPKGAQAAMREAVELQGGAPAPADRAALAETMILSAGGYVSPEAERELGLALQAEPGQPVARYYAGLALAQTGRYGLALRFWRALLREGPQDAPWIAPIRAQIGELERIAAAAGDLPPDTAPALPGPSAEDVQAAQDLSPEDRAAMIEGMVARLEGRLAEEGGAPADWARLISAYGVLNRPEDARRIWQDAERVFAEAPEALNRLRGAAVDAGVTEAAE